MSMIRGYFCFSDTFIEKCILPKSVNIKEQDIQRYEDILNSYLNTFISNLSVMRESGKYKICDAKSINPHFDKYLTKEFLPLIGINQGEYSIKYIEGVTSLLVEDMIDYFSSIIYGWYNDGGIMYEKGALYIIFLWRH